MAAIELERSWEDVQLVPERRDYWSDSCSCSNECSSSEDDDYEPFSDESEDSNQSSSTTTSEAAKEEDDEETIDQLEQQDEVSEEDISGPSDQQATGSASTSGGLQHHSSWEQLSSECVRQQIRALEDPQSQKEFYNKLGAVCSGIVESIKRQRVG